MVNNSECDYCRPLTKANVCNDLGDYKAAIGAIEEASKESDPWQFVRKVMDALETLEEALAEGEQLRREGRD